MILPFFSNFNSEKSQSVEVFNEIQTFSICFFRVHNKTTVVFWLFCHILFPVRERGKRGNENQDELQNFRKNRENVLKRKINTHSLVVVVQAILTIFFTSLEKMKTRKKLRTMAKFEQIPNFWGEKSECPSRPNSPISGIQHIYVLQLFP